jgi:hypothetical protein
MTRVGDIYALAFSNGLDYTSSRDIIARMTEGYVYIIRECNFVRLNENIYKIGRTAKINPEDRFQKYRSKANYENL